MRTNGSREHRTLPLDITRRVKQQRNARCNFSNAVSPTLRRERPRSSSFRSSRRSASPFSTRRWSSTRRSICSLSVKAATTLMGVFGAFNYGLHLFGGYLGGRFLSNRNLFVGGMALQVIGCACIATGTLRDVLRRSRLLPYRQRPQRHLHQHDADAAFHLGGSAPRRSLPLELRRHECRLLRRVQRRRLFPGDRELLEPLHFRDARQFCRHRPRRCQLEDARRPQHLAARRDAETIPAAPARRHRHCHRPSFPSCGSCSSGLAGPR